MEDYLFHKVGVLIKKKIDTEGEKVEDIIGGGRCRVTQTSLLRTNLKLDRICVFVEYFFGLAQRREDFLNARLKGD